MHERDEAAWLPGWTESILTPEQRRVLRRRFGTIDEGDADTAIVARPVDDDGGQGGGTPVPTSPSAPAGLTRPGRDGGRR